MTTPRAGIGRITAALVAIAAMLPYLTIKILWLTGSSLGVTDPNLMGTSTMLGMNALTFGMDAVALVLALAFTMRWGMRLPAWLVLLPLWVGTGLLSVVMLTAPLGLGLEGVGVFANGGPIEPWVYLTVYAGFFGQGAGLLTAFVLYARDRWPALFSTPIGYGPAPATKPFQLVVGWGALLVVALLGGTRIVWALGGGLSAVAAAQGVLKGGLAIAAGAALLVVVRGSGRRPFWQPLAAGWLGSGAMFGWGLYALIVMIVGGPLGVEIEAAAGLVELFTTLTGLVIGMCGAFVLVERLAVGDVQPPQHPLEREDRDGDRQTAHHGHR
ncbi:hypothetical protein [Nonomuraea sp. NPDC003214]